MPNTNYVIKIQQNDTGIVVEAPIPDSFAFDVGATYEQMLPQGLVGSKVINVTAAAFGTRLSVQALTAQLWAGNTDSELSFELDFHTETDPIQDVRTPIVNLLKLTMPSINTQSGFLGSPGPQIDFTALGRGFSTAVSNVGTAFGGFLGNIGSAVSNFAFGATGGLLGTPAQSGALNDSNSQANDGANSSITRTLQQNPSLGSASYWNSNIKNKITIDVGSYLHFESVVVTRVSQTFASNFDAATGLPHHVRVAVAFKPLFMLAQEDLDSLFVNPGSNTTSGTNNYGFSISKTSNVFGFHL